VLVLQPIGQLSQRRIDGLGAAHDDTLDLIEILLDPVEHDLSHHLGIVEQLWWQQSHRRQRTPFGHEPLQRSVSVHEGGSPGIEFSTG